MHYAVIEVDVKTFKFQNFPACGCTGCLYVIMRDLKQGYSKAGICQRAFLGGLHFKAIYILINEYNMLPVAILYQSFFFAGLLYDGNMII